MTDPDLMTDRDLIQPAESRAHASGCMREPSRDIVPRSLIDSSLVVIEASERSPLRRDLAPQVRERH